MPPKLSGSFSLLAVASVLAAFAGPVASQSSGRPVSQARRVSVTWERAPIGEVLQAFAAFSGTSIVAGAGVSGSVTAEINDQPWDVALASILASQGLHATADGYGIIRVENMGAIEARQTIEPLITRSYRVSYSRASELQAAIGPLLSPRGGVSVLERTNTVIVTDIEGVQRAVAALLR